MSAEHKDQNTFEEMFEEKLEEFNNIEHSVSGLFGESSIQARKTKEICFNELARTIASQLLQVSTIERPVILNQAMEKLRKDRTGVTSGLEIDLLSQTLFEMAEIATSTPVSESSS